MKKIYIVRLTDDERETCLAVIKKLKGSSEKVRRAHILLKADADGPNWKDQDIADAFLCSRQTIENVRKRLVTEGFDIALNGKPSIHYPSPQTSHRQTRSQNHCTSPFQSTRRKQQLDIVFACRPSGRIANRSAYQSRDRSSTAKKNKITGQHIQYWCITPEANAEFVESA